MRYILHQRSVILNRIGTNVCKCENNTAMAILMVPYVLIDSKANCAINVCSCFSIEVFRAFFALQGLGLPD